MWLRVWLALGLVMPGCKDEAQRPVAEDRDVVDPVFDNELELFSCATGQLAQYNGDRWICIDPPAHIDTTLTEAQVEDFVTNGPLNLDPGTQLGGRTIVTRWSDIPNIPADIADGDDDALGGLGCATGQVAAFNAMSGQWGCADGFTASQGIDAVNATLTHGDNLVPNDHFEFAMEAWEIAAVTPVSMTGSGAVQSIPDAVAGTTVFENTTDEAPWLSSSRLVPVNPNLGYTVRGAFRRTDTMGTTGSISLSVRMFDETLTEIPGLGPWWFDAVSALALTDTDWHQYSTSFGARTSVAIPANARFMSVGAVLNYVDLMAAGDRTYQVTGLGLFAEAKPVGAIAGRRHGHVLRAASFGLSSLVGEGGIWIDGGLVLQPTRSYGLVVIERATAAVVFAQSFDVFGGGANATALANQLASYSTDHIVVIATHDEPQANRTAGGLPAQILRCGGTPRFEFSMKRRAAYVLIGICDMGVGTGIELMAGDVANDTTAYVDTTVPLVDGGIPLGTGDAPCPQSWLTYGRGRNCISPLQLPPRGMYGNPGAIDICSQSEARVCTYMDIVQACGSPGFTGIGAAPAWLGDHGIAPGGNFDDEYLVTNNAGCADNFDSTPQSHNWAALPYRCCL